MSPKREIKFLKPLLCIQEERMKSLQDWIDEIQLTGNDADKRLAIGS